MPRLALFGYTWINNMATLLQIRQRFIQQSGKFDLVVDTTNYVDNGANNFIQAGQDMLDRMLPERRQIQRMPINASIGQYFLFVPKMRTAHAVYYVTSEGKKKELSYAEYFTFRELYPKLNLAATSSPPIESIDLQDTGTPTHWTIPPTGIIETWNNLNITNKNISADMDGVQIGDAAYDGTAILIGKPLDTATEVTVFGRCYSKKLASDSDTSFWSVVNPDLLVQAALYKLEVLYSNSEGMRDKESAINREIDLMDTDQAEFETIGITRMEG